MMQPGMGQPLINAFASPASPLQPLEQVAPPIAHAYSPGTAPMQMLASPPTSALEDEPTAPVWPPYPVQSHLPGLLGYKVCSVTVLSQRNDC